MRDKSVKHLILLPVVFFLCVPAIFIKENIEEIAHLNLVMFGLLAGLAVISIFLLLGANALFRRFHLNFLLGVTAEFLCFFVISTGFLFPVSVSTGMVDPSVIPIDLSNLAFAVLSAGAMLWVAREKYRQSFYTGLLIFIALNTSLSGYVILSKFTSHVGVQSLHNASARRNVFVLSFDGISGSAAIELLRKNQSLAEHFDGFTVFNRVASSSPATVASIATTLYGNKNFKARYKTEMELWDSTPRVLLTNTMQDNGYRVSTFDKYGRNFHVAKRRHYSLVKVGFDFSDLVNYTIARTLTSVFVTSGSSHLLRKLDRQVRTGFNSKVSDQFSLVNRIASSKAPSWKKAYTATVIDLEKYIRELKTKGSEPVAHFLHFTFTHYPVEFDRDCRFMGDDANWFERRQNRFGVKEETYCALSKFAEFISKLKALDVFDQSMIVLKSDHGKPASYYEPGNIEAETINGHSHWGYGRYAPFLAVKGFGSGDSMLKENSSPVLLDDLARTICVAALESSLCRNYPGFDIMDKTLIIPESATVTIFVVSSKDSDYKFDTHKPVTVNRQPDILQNLYHVLSNENIEH